MLILLRADKDPKDGRLLIPELQAEPLHGKKDSILRGTAMILLPAGLLFGVCIVLNGHLSAGGGFSGGAIIGAALILFAMAYGPEKLERTLNRKTWSWLVWSALLVYTLLKTYSFYTGAQERRAPQTQKLLDAIEIHGKSEALCDAFYAESRKLVKLTNLLTFNLRTAVLLLCVFLHFELGALGFVILVLEPIRLILLHRYENLSRNLLPMVAVGEAVPV